MNIFKQLIIFIISFFITIFTLSFPATAFKYSDLATMKFGFPFPFFVQDLSRLDPPAYPRTYVIQLPHEYPPSEWEILPWGLSVLFIMLLINIVIHIFNHLLKLKLLTKMPKY